MRELLNITNALADENRLIILFALKHGELCVCQITELLNLAPSTVSKHLSILKHAGLIDSRKQERWVYYRLAYDSPAHGVKSAINWLLKEMEQYSISEKLDKQLKEILKQDAKELCKKQLKNQRFSSSARATHVVATSRKEF